MKHSLILIDYSGTLTIGGMNFLKNDQANSLLDWELLNKFQIPDMQTFWEQLITPGWPKGAISDVPYPQLLLEQTEKLNTILYHQYSETLSRMFKQFCYAYFEAQLPAHQWIPVIKSLNSQPSISVVICSDHYIDAAYYLLRYLREQGITCSFINPNVRHVDDHQVFLAFSSLFGHTKEEKAYWHVLNSSLTFVPSEILIVDDFGANECDLDTFSQPQQVTIRKQQILNHIKDVFAITPQCIQVEKMGDLSINNAIDIFRQQFNVL
ncbi:MAG: hypothetical protein Kow00108_04820 [Calditrichia bacterium]